MRIRKQFWTYETLKGERLIKCDFIQAMGPFCLKDAD